MASTYELVKDFKKKYPNTIGWRLKKHCAIIDKNLNPNEKVLFAFAAQNNSSHDAIFDTAVLALTTDRLMIAQDRILVGYKLNTITPDLYNDMRIYRGLLFGKITIDTVKEVVTISNLSKSSLDDIETNISQFMMKEKLKYKDRIV